MADRQPLPIEILKDDFDRALTHGPVVVSAATGSGKSTRLPVWAATRGPVLVVEPRRVACTALAGFVAQQAGETLGEGVGYAIRFDARYAAHSRIVFVTPGIALRWFREGRLARFVTVMLDEFHERRWDTDLLLAMLRYRESHRLVVTSATLDGPRLGQYLNATVLESGGRGFPVSERYQASHDRQMPSSRELPQRVQAAVDVGLGGEGDMLVFMPGRREIQQTVAALKHVEADIIALHAGVPAREQQHALTPGTRRRIIVATNVAETSLTIPGVTLVIDAGLERRTHQRNGRTVLTLAPISQASADQRKGRAGRTAPGRVIRLWGENAPLEARTPPEIQREELNELVLAAASAGCPVTQLRFPDRLPPHTLERARAQLSALAAIDDQGRITDRGQALFALPVDTFFAHLIMAMPDAVSQGFMVDLSAALSAYRRPLTLPRQEEGRQALAQWQPQPCDATTLVAAVRCPVPVSLKVDRAARDEARKLAAQMRELLGLPALPANVDGNPARVFQAVMTAAPEAVYVRRESQRRRQAMGNGDSEIWVGEDSRLDDCAEAALLFDSHSVPGKGTRQTLTVGTCLAPLPLSAIVDAGLAEAEVGPVKRDSGEPQATRQWCYAGRVIGTELAEPEGVTARQVMATLILDGDLLAPAGDTLRDDLEAWQLYLALGQAEGEVPAPLDFLVDRLKTLGVETLADRDLLEPADLRFHGVPDWERERFDEKYPRAIQLADLKMRVHYRVPLKQVIVEHVSGNRKKDPKRWELPSWQGWKVKYRKASRTVDVT